MVNNKICMNLSDKNKSSYLTLQVIPLTIDLEVVDAVEAVDSLNVLGIVDCAAIVAVL